MLAERGLCPIPWFHDPQLAVVENTISSDEHAKLHEVIKRRSAELAEDFERGFTLLCQHYGIDELERQGLLDPTIRYYGLALCLACDHVPYFQSHARGRKPDTVNGFELATAVEQKKREGAKSDLEAIRRLQKAGKFKRQHPDDLRKKLARARKDPRVAILLKVAEALPQYRDGMGYDDLITSLRPGTKT